MSLSNYRAGLFSGLGAGLCLAFAVGVGTWIAVSKANSTPSAAAQTPATVKKTAKEDQFNTITLQPEAEANLKIKLGTVETKEMTRHRSYNGEVTIPTGQAILVAAPLSGALRAVSAKPLRAGDPVKKGQPIFQLFPILTPEGRANLATARVDAEGEGLFDDGGSFRARQAELSTQESRVMAQTGSSEWSCLLKPRDAAVTRNPQRPCSLSLRDP